MHGLVRLSSMSGTTDAGVHATSAVRAAGWTGRIALLHALLHALPAHGVSVDARGPLLFKDA